MADLLRFHGVAFTCKKGLKQTPNQDDFCILRDGPTTLLGVFDGHGENGHICSNIIQRLFPKVSRGPVRRSCSHTQNITATRTSRSNRPSPNFSALSRPFRIVSREA